MTLLSNLLSSERSRGSRRHREATLLTGRAFLIVLVTLIGFCLGETHASAQGWSLTTAQRKAYLNYYAPVILKRGDENDGKEGRDWLTNFDFDQDGNFSNNRTNWRSINQYVAAAASGPSYYDQWRIRPTLYSALIEYMEGGSKSLVLLYHVYNAADKDGSEIHDWERVEIVVHGVTGTPGASGEVVNHVTVTLHKEHHIRRSYEADLNFMQTATGKHVLLWQADESNWDINDPKEPNGHELHFVKNTYSWIVSQASVNAKVNISSKDDMRNVHYAFVPEGSQAAVDAWRATPLNYSAASGLASRVDNGDTVLWSQVKRITYELQDLADIVPTHWQYNNWQAHWLSSKYVDVLLETPIVSESGQLEVSAGLQRFYTASRDSGSSSLTDGREGTINKRWYFGGYSAELDPEYPSNTDDFKGFEGLGTDSYGVTRGVASGYYNSHGAYWWQHDYFVHSGPIVDAETVEAGKWLTGAWYTPANGGFDGRWVQLFDDRPGYEPPTPLTLTLSHLAGTQRCADTRLVTAKAVGGTPPYTFTWSTGQTITSTSTSQVTVPINTYVTVTARDAAGTTRTSPPYYVNAYCTDGVGPR